MMPATNTTISDLTETEAPELEDIVETGVEAPSNVAVISTAKQKITHPEETPDDTSKTIARELVDLEILYLLGFGPKSGYELKKNLFRSFRLNLSYGTLYPHLHALEKNDLICGTWKFQEDATPLRKRMYTLTEVGLVKLGHSIETLSTIGLTMQFIRAKLDLNPETGENGQNFERTLGLVKEIFLAQGYTAATNARLKGNSGTEHRIDLAAARKNGSERVVVKVISGESGATIDDVLRTVVMANDLLATRTIIVSTPIADGVAKLSKSYGIFVYVGSDPEEIAAKMSQDLIAENLTA